MSVFSLRAAAILAAPALLGLTSCSKQPVAVEKGKTPDFYWSAARETWAAGDYIKTADHLDHLLSSPNEYTGRAIPWSLVLTAGMAAGYMELADDYTAGAHIKKSNALAFHHKAYELRAAASKLALHFAENVEIVGRWRTGPVPLAFPFPRGTAAQPGLASQIARGIELSPTDGEETKRLIMERNVLLAACLVAGAPNDAAKTADIFAQDNANVARPVFAKGLAEMLNRESTLYERQKLDDPDKLAIFKQRAQFVLSSAGSSPIIVKAAAQ
jgi:hypothetical protein